MALRARLLGSLVAAILLAATPTAGAGQGPAAAEPLRVGIVLEPSAPHSFSSLALQGFERAVHELGITKSKVLRPPPKEGFFASFRYLALRGYDLVIAVGVGEGLDAYRAALAYPRTRFAIVDVPLEAAPTQPPPRNLEGVTFAVEEASFLAGDLAARMEERRPGRDVVSAVAGSKNPWVDAFIAGFRAGARRADPKISTPYAYTGSYGELDRARCRNVALDQIAHGSGVVFPVAGGCGVGALEAVKERGVFGIGVDVDQSALGPHILTSVLKRIDVAVFETVRSATEGRYRSGRTVELGLREGAVGLGRISPRVPRTLVAEVARLRRLVVSGAVTGIPATLGKPAS